MGVFLYTGGEKASEGYGLRLPEQKDLWDRGRETG
jgi:hypothetical protein